MLYAAPKTRLEDQRFIEGFDLNEFEKYLQLIEREKEKVKKDKEKEREKDREKDREKEREKERDKLESDDDIDC